MVSGEDVQLPDLQVIQRYSLAVRGATAPVADVVAALQADLAWLTGGSRRRTVEASAPSAPTRSAPSKSASMKSAPAKKTAVKTAAAKPAGRKTAAKRSPAKKSAAKKSGARRA